MTSLGLAPNATQYAAHEVLWSKRDPSLSPVLATLRIEVEERLRKHHDISDMPSGPQRDAIQARMVLPTADHRIVEMLVHAVYTGKLERMDGWGHFRSSNYDYDAVYALADELQLRSLQTHIYNETGERRFRRHDSSIRNLQRSFKS